MDQRAGTFSRGHLDQRLQTLKLESSVTLKPMAKPKSKIWPTMKKLIETGQLAKVGSPPKVFYILASKVDQEQSLLKRYALDRTEANSFFNSAGLIDATINIGRIFNGNMSLDKVFYLDFYSLPTFSKTRLGTSVLYAKQSENQEMIRQLANEAKPEH